MKTERWPEKTPLEKVWASFDFRAGLDVGETISSVAVSVTLKGGVDASPDAILSTQTVIGGRVMQRIQGGVDGAAYLVRCLATTSTTRVLQLAGIVPVREP